MAQTAAVFVHGVFSAGGAWTPMIELLRSDPEATANLEMLLFEYPSPPLSLRLTRRIPDLATLAESLATFYETRCAEYERVVFITHSQGGLVLQRFLAMMLADGRGEELARIRRVIMFACPNNGSELLLSLRKSIGFWWRHPQERQLRPLAETVVQAQRRVLNGVVFAATVASDRCPIPFMAYAGESDNVVTPASARFVFPNVGTLPGDHRGIIRPQSHDDRGYVALRSNLALSLVEPYPSFPNRSNAFKDTGPKDVFTELSVSGPRTVRLDSRRTIETYIQAGPIDQVRGIDVVVSSENIYLEMAKPFKPSTSGRLRRAAAIKSPSGEIIDDCTFKELADWMKRNGRHGLPVIPGTVVPTTSGEMINSGIKRIYHAAVVTPELGTGRYTVDSSSISACVHNILRLARKEREEIDGSIRSICIPLLGCGRAGLDPRVSIDRIWAALVSEIGEDEDWAIHFSTWWRAETAILESFLASRGASRD